MLTPLRLFPTEDETIEGVGAAVRAGKTTCAAVLERCFHQIDLWDDRVHAWAFVDRAGAMHQARALDGELAGGRCRGPLHGIPIGVKDIIDVKGMPTSAGFKPWRERVAERDAELVAALRRAGAVILGKTVTTQFAWIDPPKTRNPWNLDRTPGGSSSGSAAAVATGMCLGAVGSQTGGSIIRPASFCGVAGLKPSYGLVSENGVVPLAPTLDHPGPIARTVRDLYLLFTPLWSAEGDPGDDASAPTDALSDTWFEEPDAGPPRLLRPRGFFDRRADPDTLGAFEAALRVLAAVGAEVVDVPEGAIDFEAILREHRTLLAAEAAAGHEARFAEHPEEYLPQIRALVEEGLATPLTRYVRSQLAWRCETGLPHARLFGDHDGPQAVVTPATVGPAPDASTTGNPCFNSPWSYLGWPALSFPIGLSPDGLPLALQLIGSPYNEPFGVASWCESVIRRASAAGSP